MQESAVHEVIVRALNSAITLYMLAILVRWTAPWIQLELTTGPLRMLPRITDPLIDLMRQLLGKFMPPPNSFDWGPIAALLVVWIVRLLLFQY